MFLGEGHDAGKNQKILGIAARIGSFPRLMVLADTFAASMGTNNRNPIHYGLDEERQTSKVERL